MSLLTWALVQIAYTAGITALIAAVYQLINKPRRGRGTNHNSKEHTS